MADLIHWHEGLFLQPHHLQQLQHKTTERINFERRYSLPYSYGIAKMQISNDDLQNHTLRLTELEVIMPSGVLIKFPSNADIAPLDFKSEFRSSASPVTIYLGLPIWSEDRPNTTGNENSGASATRYQVVDNEVADENSGQNSQIVQFRKLNALLVTDSQREDHKGLEFIPLVRVGRTTSQNVQDKPVLDAGFVGPTIQLGGSSILKEMLRGLLAQLSSVREEYSELLADSVGWLDDLRGESLKHFLRLRVLSRFEGRLLAVIDADCTPLLDAYLALRELLAEFASLEPHHRDFVTSNYDHDQPYPCFSELAARIKKYLVGPKPSYLRLDFFLEESHYTTPIAKDIFKDASGNFIAIKTSQDVSELCDLVETSSQFQLLPASIARDKVAVRGVVLKECRDVPYGLPREPNLYYFRICSEESRDLWARLIDDTHAWVQFSNAAASDYEISLVIHKPVS